MKKMIVLLGIAAICANLYAQNANLKGIVTDKKTGEKIKDAKVTLAQGKAVMAEMLSDANGEFYFTQQKQGMYSLKIEHSRYNKEYLNHVWLSDNKTTEVKIQLSKKAKENEIKEEFTVIEDEAESEEMFFNDYKMPSKRMNSSQVASGIAILSVASDYDLPFKDFNTESYDIINENQFKDVLGNPLSTFSVDVDRASYSNVRRFLKQNQMPVKDAVRIEELVNYFDYNYPQPKGEEPFSINLELSTCPWNTAHDLLLIGLQGKEVNTKEIPAGNLVFLIDVSGSMQYVNKLPLLKQAFKILVDNLRPQDRVAMVVYAGAAGVVLQSTSGTEKNKILGALEQLKAGGSTAGGEGIKLAYKIAKENYIIGGNNRVILATDGDFNIGASSDAEMVRLIEDKRKDGIFLSVLGFGMGNYKDSKMEQVSNAGNGNYAYIDNILEAKKVFGKEIWGTLYTIAKDVKFQLEFNPSQVKAYRLIGYENRMLNKEDFNDDKKDAGEIGSGHTVTALYEIIQAGSTEEIPGVDPLEFQKTETIKNSNMLTVKLRYKEPNADESKLIKHSLQRNDIWKKQASENLMFASSVAEFGMILRDSEFKKDASYDQVLSMAKQAKGTDTDGYRSEFISLVEMAQLLNK